MPPPPPVGASAELPLRVQLITLNVEWSLYMPPPYRPEAEPLMMLRPEIPALAPSLTWKTRLAWLASTAKFLGPGPLMLTILFTTTEFVNPPWHGYGRRVADYPPSREATARRRGLNGLGGGNG